VVAVLHDLNLAATFADRILMLHRARVAADGAPQLTITKRLLAEVFGVSPARDRSADDTIPFVLPQMLTVSRPDHR
jgi:iron complex transport system ATP-binding protein